MLKSENSQSLLLSIAIPAYNRPQELSYSIVRFISQICGKYDKEIEIIISDDCSPDDSLSYIRQLVAPFNFIRYQKYDLNIGLEQNLIACTEMCTGEYLWIFGDDDFIEPHDGIEQIVKILREAQHDVYILNRTRRNADLSKLISENWMEIDINQNYEFSGLREFCLVHGFISIIGFISVNIFRRKYFKQIDVSKYIGTMYPQLGAMVEAFYNRKTLLIGCPVVCQRTRTAEEKRIALGGKAKESIFFSNEIERNATYFSHSFIHMLYDLVQIRAFLPDDVIRIPEKLFGRKLIDFLIQNFKLSQMHKVEIKDSQLKKTLDFFDNLQLSSLQREIITSNINTPKNHIDVKKSLFYADINFEFNKHLNRLIIFLRDLKQNYSNIALYGYGLAGQIALNELEDQVVVIVDKNACQNNINGIPFVKPEYLKHYSFDCVVITVLGRESAIRAYLGTRLNINSDKIITINLGA